MEQASSRFDLAQPSIMTTVAGLYLHGPRPAVAGDAAPTPMVVVPEVEAIARVGLRGEARHMRERRPDEQESKRQVSLIDAGTLARHAERFGGFPMEFVKSQIVLAGSISLPDLLGHYLVFGAAEDAAVLQLTIRRDPCEAMDLIAPGLRLAMAGGQQGALARVVRGGRIALGQSVTIHMAQADVESAVRRD
jgi:hypothetical protein